MKEKQIVINYKEFDASELTDPELNHLINKAKEASQSSYSPYSEFSVGAAVLLDNGNVVQGSNQENAAYPSGICAERVAVFYANSNFPENKIIAIAIAAKSNNEYIDEPIPPCGACRQVLLESENRNNGQIKLILYGRKRSILLESVSALLPVGFNQAFLKKRG
ncbi:MAG: cytidine deaminase [Bacteroidales bacterium]